MDSVLPFLWINHDAADAVALYERLFDDAEVLDVGRDPGSDGTLMTATVRIGDISFMVFNGEPHMQMPGSQLVSFMVLCDDQDEVDRYWDGLSDGGTPSQCGWVTDRFGVTWQIVPRLFRDLTSTGDVAASARVFEAMMTMTKFDCAALQAAFDAG